MTYDDLKEKYGKYVIPFFLAASLLGIGYLDKLDHEDLIAREQKDSMPTHAPAPAP